MDAELIARLSVAMIAAISFINWSRRLNVAEETVPSPARAHSSVLRGVLVALSLIWGVWAGIAVGRLSYPYELEWNGGAMRDHCARLLQGIPLYIRRRAIGFPGFYTPFYFQLCAAIMRLSGGQPTYLAMRIVSVASTCGIAAVLFLWTRRLCAEREIAEERTVGDSPLGSSRAAVSQGREEADSTVCGLSRPTVWGICAAGLFFAAYKVTGAWFDIERNDSLFVFLSVAGCCILGRASRSVTLGSLTAAAFGALLLSLAVLTKQQGIVFIAGAVAALALTRRWQFLLAVLGASLVISGGALFALDHQSAGWFRWYCFFIPSRQGIRESGPPLSNTGSSFCMLRPFGTCADLDEAELPDTFGRRRHDVRGDDAGRAHGQPVEPSALGRVFKHVDPGLRHTCRGNVPGGLPSGAQVSLYACGTDFSGDRTVRCSSVSAAAAGSGAGATGLWRSLCRPHLSARNGGRVSLLRSRWLYPVRPLSKHEPPEPDDRWSAAAIRTGIGPSQPPLRLDRN